MATEQELKDTTNVVLAEEVEQVLATDTRAERRLVRKQDMIILPLLSLAYLLGHLDRGQIGNARLMGFQEALHLTDRQYFQCLMIMYVGFLVVELPAALLMRIIPAQSVFGGAILLFGVCATLVSVSTNFAHIMVLRLFLGFGEATLALGFLYLSLWYKHDELALRSCIIFWSTPFSGFASGLISYGVAKHLDFAHGMHSWQWLFIVEGIPTIAMGIIIIFVLPSFPDRVAKRGHFLFRSPEEHELLLLRTAASQNTPGAKIVPRQFLIGLKDPKTYLCSLAMSAPALGIAAFNVFLPTFIRSYGFDRLTAQLYTIIPYSFAIVTMPLFCWLSDKYRARAIPMAGCLSLCIIGFIMILASSNSVTSIAGCCFVAAGAYPATSICASWISTMHGGYTKRSFAYGVCQVFINSFSIMGTQIFNTPPRFYKGNGVLLGIFVLALVCCGILYFTMKRQNQRRDIQAEMRRNGTAPPLENIGSFEDLCDYHPDWRYPL